MSISRRTPSPLDTTREAEPNAQAKGVVAVEDTARSEPGDPTTEHNGSNGHAKEAIPLLGLASRPVVYPTWPTSRPGPQATPPPSGQHPHPRRTDQMMYFFYDQERGRPGVAPPEQVVVRKQRGKTYLSDERV